MASTATHERTHARAHGVFPAIVSDLKDPDSQGRVKVKLPWLADSGGDLYETWARVATMMGGSKRGTWFIPDVDDEVLVSFEAGDPRRPYVVGALWNGKDSPPLSMDGAGKNSKKQICSRNGVKVTLDDTDGQETLTLETPGGQKMTLKDGPGSVQIEDSNGNSVKLDSAGMVKVDAGMTKFSGVVQCDTLISNSVVSASYTPGAGNIW